MSKLIRFNPATQRELADQSSLANTSTVTDVGVQSAFSEVPTQGKPLQVADDVWWLRLPLRSSLGHVNLYVLEDTDGWTVVDTGENTAECKAALEATFIDGPLSHRRVSRVIATHHHPDHIGLVGWFVERGATLWATRLCWLYARMLQLDDRELPCEAQIEFARRAGVKGLALAAYCRQRPSNFSQLVQPLPFSYEKLEQDDWLTIGQRRWQIHIGHGHATGHATLWSDDGLAITGDQILPGISSNLSVHASEPDADLVSEWLDSCQRLQSIALDSTLCLPGHNAPFTGAATRCKQLITNQEMVLKRLLQRLERPGTAVECLDAVYRRKLDDAERPTLIAETVGYLNHLKKRGLVGRELARDGSYVWRLSSSSRSLENPIDRNAL